jgi:hypothetical protein
VRLTCRFLVTFCDSRLAGLADTWRHPGTTRTLTALPASAWAAMTLGRASVLAHTVCAALRRRLPGYGTATPDTLQRRFLTGGIITSDRDQITVRLSRRTCSPVLRQATLPQTITAPWWQGRTLRSEYA